VKLYKSGSFIYYEDGSDEYVGSEQDLQFRDHQNGDVTIWFYQNRGREHKTFSEGLFAITDVLDIDGNAYGTTVKDITDGLNIGVDINIPNGIDGLLDVGNSSSTPLVAGDTFPGVSVDSLNYGMVIINIKTDQNSAINGLDIQFSSDNVNWDHSDVFTIISNGGKVFTFQTVARYMRVRYTNGPVTQGFFRLQTILKPSYVKPSSHRIADSLSGQDDAELVKSILSGEDEDNVFQNVKTTRDGALTITDNSNGLAISEGLVTGKSPLHKFGIAPDFDTSDLVVTIWDGADDAGIDQMEYIFSTTDDIDSLISTDNTDAVDIVVIGLDINYNEIEQTIALTGQVRAPLTTPLLRVYRMYNDGAVDLGGVVSCYVDGPVSSGVVNNSADVRALIRPPNNQTLMAVYTVPAGKTAYLREWYGNIAGSKKTSNYIFTLRVRVFGKIFRTVHVSALSDSGTSYIQHLFEEPPIALEKSDILLTCELTEVVTGAGVAAGFDIVLVDD